MIISLVGSVRPTSNPAMGLKGRGRSEPMAPRRWKSVLARAILAIGPSVDIGKSRGIVLIDSAPPARMIGEEPLVRPSALPARIRWAASATASIPDAQLR